MSNASLVSCTQVLCHQPHQNERQLLQPSLLSAAQCLVGAVHTRCFACLAHSCSHELLKNQANATCAYAVWQVALFVSMLKEHSLPLPIPLGTDPLFPLTLQPRALLLLLLIVEQQC